MNKDFLEALNKLEDIIVLMQDMIYQTMTDGVDCGCEMKAEQMMLADFEKAYANFEEAKIRQMETPWSLHIERLERELEEGFEQKRAEEIEAQQ